LAKESVISLLKDPNERDREKWELSVSAGEHITWLKGEVPTVIAGSGVSIWEPTDLPSGQDFTKAVFSVLFSNVESDGEKWSAAEWGLLEKIFGKQWSARFSGMPFEHLMECCPSETKAATLISHIYDSRQPSPVHLSLAKALKGGKIHAIITPNYDCCIEEAFDQEGTTYQKIVTPEQIRQALRNNHSPCYFKIHGSLEEGLPNSPMFTLKHEGLLSPDKRELLTQLITGRPLVMIGYSGLDFEICPEIERLSMGKLIWNNLYKDYPSVSGERLLQNKKGVLLFGDMRFLLASWLGLNAMPELTPPKEGYVQEVIRQIFTDAEIGSWRVRVLNSLGLPAFVLRASESLPVPTNLFFERVERGRAHFHAGRYKVARRQFLRAMVSALMSAQRQDAADAALEASDAYRSYGAPVRAYFCTQLARLFAGNTIEAKNLIKQSLIIRDVLEIARALKRFMAMAGGILSKANGTIVLALERILKEKLVRCARHALETGNWIDFQQVALIAESLDIDIPDLGAGEYYAPPKAAEGYRHLGYYIPQAMTFTAKCLKDRDSFYLNYEVCREWRFHIRTCSRLGIDSSLWKLLALSSSRKIKERAWHVFGKCEYGVCKAFFDWKKYSGDWRLR
jgi:hypothetical protein